MKKIILVVLILLLVCMAYGAVATFSEDREYSRTSLDYYLLTPKVLAQLSKHCESSPRFIYHSADGPKPVIIHLHCSLDSKVKVDYMSQKGFKQVSDDQFKKGPVEIEFQEDDRPMVIVTTLYEYL